MKTVNSVTLLGSITKKPEKRITSSGKSFSTFVLTTYKDSQRGGERSPPEFHNIVAWGGLGSIAETFCKKNAFVYLEGYLKTRSWNHENGAKIFRTEIVATNIIAMNDLPSSSEHLMGKKGDLKNYTEDDFFTISLDDFFNTEPEK